jgi:hypothetical protein
MTVLRYLRNVSSRFKIFVAHRVQQIQDLTDVHAWNYVPSEKNPADLASRGVHPTDQQKLEFWLNGPTFLKQTRSYDRLFEEPSDAVSELEVRTSCAVEYSADTAALLNHYSDLTCFQRAVVWLRKFSNYLRGNQVSKDITVTEMWGALLSLIKFVQLQVFKEEF